MSNTYALIPAAGAGSRMGSSIPKQYQMLADKPLICHTIETLCAVNAVRMVCVVLAPGDTRFRDIEWGAGAAQKVQPLYCGGATRAASVLNGLIAMAGTVDTDDWVMVHDAARPCLSVAMVDKAPRAQRTGCRGRPCADAGALRRRARQGAARGHNRAQRRL